MPADQIGFWTRDNLDRVSEILKTEIGRRAESLLAKRRDKQSPFPQILDDFCEKHDIRPGSPEWFVKNAHYGTDVVADWYDIEEFPVHWEWKNAVVVKNPFFSIERHYSRKTFLNYKFLEMDEDFAKKILVLGVP